jgi:hypothetical protein
MSISVAGINLVDAVVNLEYEMMRTQQYLEWLQRNNPGLRWPDAPAVAQINDAALTSLKKKYPEAGIARK